MRDNQESGAGDRPAHDQQPEATSDSGKGFPTHAVVGVIDEPGEVLRAADELRAAGFKPDVLCSERGVERIEDAGGSARDVRVTRMVQNLFGYEADHTGFVRRRFSLRGRARWLSPALPPRQRTPSHFSHS